MALSVNQKKHLRGLGHSLKPIVMVGDAGITDALLDELETQIAHHELVKVKVRAGGRDARDSMIDELCRRGDAELVTRIGNVALLYRRNEEEPKVALPRR